MNPNTLKFTGQNLPNRPLHVLRDRQAITNLPTPLTSFIGRNQEISELAQLLTTTRLLTLSGAGGIGKTRLAIEVASQMLDQFGEGVWWVELAPLSDGQLIPQAISRVLQLRDEPDHSSLAILLNYLQNKEILLVLDNCEHLIRECAVVLEKLLLNCPALQVLVTSREALAIGGEVIRRVPSLSLPEPQTLSQPDLDRLAQSESIQLFLERVRAGQPDFALTSHNANLTTAICEHLDGMPLAIELAAARTKVLSLEQIAARLQDRFRFLTGGSRTALPRQQTLAATIEWSYELLSGKEQTLLRRLAVFASGCTLEAAEAVAAGLDLEPAEVLDSLTQLVNKSLVITGLQKDSIRFGLLETIRQYGREKLEESGEAATVQQIHLNYFLKLAEQAALELKGAGQISWLARLEVERANLRSAFEHALSSRDLESGLRLVGALWPFWFLQSHYSEGRGWAAEILPLVAGWPPCRSLAQVITADGDLAIDQGNFAEAQSLLAEALTMWRELGDEAGIATGLSSLVHLTIHQRNFAAAGPLLRECLELYERMGDQWGIAITRGRMGWEAWGQKDFGTARTLLQQALNQLRELGDQEELGKVLNRLGELARYEGNDREAWGYYVEALDLFHALGQTSHIAMVLFNFAFILQHEGNFRRSGEMLWEGLDLLLQKKGTRIFVHTSLVGLGCLAALRKEAELAARLFGAAENYARKTGDSLDLADQVDYDRNLQLLKSLLDEASLARAWDEGRELTIEQALAFAKPLAGPGLAAPTTQNPPDRSESAGSFKRPHLQEVQTANGLTRREIEVLGLVAAGLTDAQVAEKLVLSPRTVSKHLQSIYSKLELPSRSAATRYALEHHLA